MPASIAAQTAENRVVLVPNPFQSGVVGFGAALAFLAYIAKFGERVQTDAVDKNVLPQGLLSLMSLRWGILVKTCSAREIFTSTSLALCLLLRTFGSVWISRRWGAIVGSVVSLDFGRLLRGTVQFAGASVLLSALNALLKFHISALKLNLREKITRWCHEMYLTPGEMVFYKVNRLGEARLAHCDHQMTSDIERFSEAFTEVISQGIKPVIDFIVYSMELSCVSGLLTPLTLYAWFAFASRVSALVLPPFGDLAAKEQQLEGEFRHRHSQLIAQCEPIAFLGGEEPERKVLNGHLDKLMSHCWDTTRLSLNYEVVRQYLNKYFVTVIGLYLVSRPLRINKLQSNTQVAQYFTETWKNMELLTSAIQALFDLANRIGRLSGFAKRVNMLMQSLESPSPVLSREVEQAMTGSNPPRFLDGDSLRFEHVSIYKPDGMLLVKDLNFEIAKGDRILITGGNGGGKSSLFRVVRKLWPLVEGTITMPPDEEVHFISQSSFVPVGTLRDIIIYPHSLQEMQACGRTDKDVHLCLLWAHVSPKHVVSGRAQLEFTIGSDLVRPDLDDVHDWQSLSPGIKQRLAFARLFYHRPSFVILDECTNGVSPDVEHDLYDRCRRLQMGVVSIAHKMELKLFHDKELRFSGDPEGSWSVDSCSDLEGKITRSSAVIRRPEPDEKGRMESKIMYERHIWYFE